MKKRMKIILTLLLAIYAAGAALNGIVFKSADTSSINVMTDRAGTFDFDIHSRGYLLVDLSDFEILYARNNDIPIFPASLTKVMTMDTVLNLAEDLDDVSYVADDQVEDLIREDASLAYIQRDYDYTLRDLLYALILPSGADAALALENYFAYRGIDLVEQMNIHAAELGCTNTHFVNTTGLHDDDHYTSLNDLFRVVMDVLKYPEGRKLMSTLFYTMEDDTRITTGIRMVANRKTVVRGGKTGYTPEAGENIIVLYRCKGRSYVLLLCNAMGSYLKDQYWHFDDTLKIFDELY